MRWYYLLGIVIAPILFQLVLHIAGFVIYMRSEFRSITGISFFSMLTNPDLRAVYNTYKNLERVSDEGRFLFGCRIPYCGENVDLGMLLIHENGIYCFQCPDIQGTISGSSDGELWIAKRKRRGELIKETFPNPLLSYEKQEYALRSYLGGYGVPLISFVVFGNKCRFQKVPYGNADCSVVLLQELRSIMKMDIASRGLAITSSDILDLYDRLLPISGHRPENPVHPKKTQKKKRRTEEGAAPERRSEDSSRAEVNAAVFRDIDGNPVELGSDPSYRNGGRERIIIEHYETFEAEQDNEFYEEPAEPQGAYEKYNYTPGWQKIPVIYYPLSEITDDMFEEPEEIVQ